MEERPNNRETERLIRKSMHGSFQAFGQLIHLYQDYLYRTAYLYMKNEDDALDVVQDCILTAYEAVGGLRKPEYFRTWLTRILINCALKALQDGSRIMCMEELPEQGSGRDAHIEERCDLYHAVDRLPEQYRTVVILKYYNDMKISEISEIMDIPEGSVKSYLFRAKKELRTYLQEDYVYAE
ncbi:MAG: sigma-70 family RNA polymerase sigma factor [Lachnospiraceae bacterium]|nr:sigma-70 family RNA polymerase sigma factor [Lachnospiraceae bacterium]